MSINHTKKSHDIQLSDKSQCIIYDFSPTFTKQVYVVTNQLLQEGSVTWDLSHSLNIVTPRPMALV